jgi:hypothetical protein
MALVGVPLPDPTGESLTLMARCLIEEFLLMGLDEERLLGLFRNPFYRGPHAIYQARGEAFVRELVQAVRGQFSTESPSAA